MKKQFLFVIISILLSAFCFSQNSTNLPSATINVTFQVQNPATTPVYLFGSWTGWGNWPGDPMTSIGGGAYAVTLPLTSSTNYEYLFVNGTTPVKEALNPAWSCTNGNATYTNRVLVTGSSDATVCFVWATCTTCSVPVPLDLPVTFDNSNVNYNLVDFGGAASSIVADPVVPTNLVCKVIKSNTAETWAGTTIGGATGMATPIPFVAGSTKMHMSVYSPNAGIPVRMKVEVVGDPTKSVETEALTTVANAWQTLEFNFANQATGTAPINFTYSYKMLSVFFNFGTTGAAAGTKTYYCDDIAFGAAPAPLIDLPITFDNPSINYNLVDFGGNASSIVADPVVPTNLVCKVIKSNTAETWAGTTIGGATGMATPIPFVAGSTKMHMSVYSPNAGIPVRMKVEVVGDPTKSVETEALTTVANAWQTLEFNFANQATGTAPINFTYSYKMLTVFFNFGTSGAAAGTKTYYCDDIAFGPAPVLIHVDLPVTFDNPLVNYDLVDFGGNASSLAADPVVPANHVCKVIKSNTAETWAGTTIGGNTGGFANPVPFVPGATSMTIKVYSPDAGILVRMKVEDPNDPTKSVETQVNTTVANAWQTLTFNFANQATGTAPINYSYTYQKLSVFFNFGTSGASAGTKTYYCDDIAFVPPVLTQVDLPVTFDNSTVNYDLVDFGGNASSIVADPVVPTNHDCKVIKSNIAELWAGTTIGGNTGGFANPVPFVPGFTTMTMRVYSPDAGIPVRMKVEDPNDPTKSVETQVNTTLADAWETLTFNFASQASGTAPINFTYTYKKLSVFFNFGTTGATAGTKTYYCDDIEFGGSGPTSINVTFQVQNPDSTNVYVFGSWSNWGNWPGDPMTSIGNNTYTATLTLAPNSNFEFLYVNGNAPVKEVLNPAWSCTNNNPQYTNRVLALSSLDTTLCFEWASCLACGSAPIDSITVTFKVQNPDSIPVYVFGNWSNWSNWPGTPMTTTGNNIYETTMRLKSNQNVEYLFVNGVGPTKEVLDPSWSCTNGNTQYTNRLSALSGTADTTICFLWNHCLACGTTSVNTLQGDDIKVNLGHQGIRVFSNTITEADQIGVYDMLGRTVYFSDKKQDLTNLIPMRLSSGSIYLITIKNNNRIFTFKGILMD